MPKFNPEHFPGLLRLTYDAVLQQQFQGHCIQAGAFLMLLLHRIGYPNAYHLTVGVDVYNPALSRWCFAYLADPATAGPQPDDSMYVRLGKGCERIGEVPAGDWAGHLVVVVPNAYGDSHAVFDPTVCQVNRPSEDIKLPPILFAARDGFAAGVDTFKIEANGMQVRYTAYPDDLSFNEPEDSSLRQDFIEAADDMSQKLRELT